MSGNPLMKYVGQAYPPGFYLQAKNMAKKTFADGNDSATI